MLFQGSSPPEEDEQEVLWRSLECAGAPRATRDPCLLRHPRALRNLLSLEGRGRPAAPGSQDWQAEIQPYMREMLAFWMLEVGLSSGLLPTVGRMKAPSLRHQNPCGLLLTLGEIATASSVFTCPVQDLACQHGSTVAPF